MGFFIMMKKFVHIFTGWFFLSHLVFAQGDIDEQSRIFYRNESSFGLILHTSGYGISYRYGQRINYFDKQLYEAGFHAFRHPKEVKINNPIWPNNRSFVFGKMNSLFWANIGYGFQREIYRKFDIGGIAIRYFFTGGPSVALYKPVYYQKLELIPPNDYVITTEKFNESFHQATDIFGRAGFFKGVDETRALPGIYMKGGINFEYSRYDEILHALEIGGMINAFAKKIPIMANEKATQVVVALFVSYRFGKIFDPKAPESERQRRREPALQEDLIY